LKQTTGDPARPRQIDSLTMEIVDALWQ
jgi:hypothetical protein